MHTMTQRMRLTIYVGVFLIMGMVHFAYAATSPAANYLLDLGTRFYNQRNLNEALDKFKKVLILDPENQRAKEFIQKIRHDLGIAAPGKEEGERKATNDAEARREFFRKFKVSDTTREFIQGLEKERGATEPLPIGEELKILTQAGGAAVGEEGAEERAEERAELPQTVEVTLDDALVLSQPDTKIEMDRRQTLRIHGQGIQRVLSVDPDLLEANLVDATLVEVKAKSYGSGYLYVWDQRQRWVIGVDAVPLGIIKKKITLQKLSLPDTVVVEPFKLGYTFTRTLSSSGRRMHSLRRSTYSVTHYLDLRGETPYGEVDSIALVSQTAGKRANLTYFTLGLTDAKWRDFEDIEVRGFDYGIDFGSNVGSANLRGVRLSATHIPNNADILLAWGREGSGRYGPLSPGLSKPKDRYINGGRFTYRLSDQLTYGIGIAHGYGKDRDPTYPSWVYGLDMGYKLGIFRTDYWIAEDSLHRLSKRLGLGLGMNRLLITARAKEVDKNFTSISGAGSDRGKIGGVITLNYNPWARLGLSHSVDVYKDKLNPNPEYPDRLNIESFSSLNLALAESNSLRFSYRDQDDRGQSFPRRFQDYGAYFIQGFKGYFRPSLTLGFDHQVSRNPGAPTSDYTANRASVSLRTRLISNLYHYFTRRINWITDDFNGNGIRSYVWETGLNYSAQLGKSPYYFTWSLSYHDEENAESRFSFLTGQDTLETSGELSYRPYPDFSAYISWRIRNNWAEKEGARKGINAYLNTGAKLNFDTNMRWNPNADISGYVFKDLNADGQMQEGEPGVAGVKIAIGRKLSQLTDAQGHYLFPKVRGKKAYVGIDLTTIPPGYTLTTPSSHAVDIHRQGKAQVNFGVVSRSSVQAVVFVDKNGDGRFNAEEKGVQGVLFTMENGASMVSDQKGEVMFSNVAAGPHRLSIDVESLSVDYLPEVPIIKDFVLLEGVTYSWYIPLQETGQ